MVRALIALGEELRAQFLIDVWSKVTAFAFGTAPPVQLEAVLQSVEVMPIHIKEGVSVKTQFMLCWLYPMEPVLLASISAVVLSLYESFTSRLDSVRVLCAFRYQYEPVELERRARRFETEAPCRVRVPVMVWVLAASNVSVSAPEATVLVRFLKVVLPNIA